RVADTDLLGGLRRFRGGRLLFAAVVQDLLPAVVPVLTRERSRILRAGLFDRERRNDVVAVLSVPRRAPDEVALGCDGQVVSATCYGMADGDGLAASSTFGQHHGYGGERPGAHAQERGDDHLPRAHVVATRPPTHVGKLAPGPASPKSPDRG